jgi:hypothetical protein
MRGAIPPLPNTPSWRGAQLKQRDSFTFTSTCFKSDLIYRKLIVTLALINGVGNIC